MVPEEDEVEIDHPGPPPFFARAVPAHRALDREEGGEQARRVERCAERERTVEVVGLVDGADGVGLDERGAGEDARAFERIDLRDRALDGAFAVSEVRAERDGGVGGRHDAR